MIARPDRFRFSPRPASGPENYRSGAFPETEPASISAGHGAPAAPRRFDLLRRGLGAAGLAAIVAGLLVLTVDGFASGLAGLVLGLGAAGAFLSARLGAADLAAARAEEEARHLAARLDAAEAERDAGLARAEAHERHLAARPELVVRRDAAGHILYANPAFAAAMGAPAEAVLGQIAHPALLAGMPGAEAGAVAPGDYDQLIETGEGPRWIAWRDAALIDETGATIAIESVGRDVSARKTDEHALAEARVAAEAASEAKSRFLAGMSHEIRTPLSGILGMAGLLHDTALTPEQKTYARAIEASGTSLLGLIDELLDLTRIEQGADALTPARVSPAALIEQVTELLGPRAQERGLEIASYLAPDMPAAIECDGGRLRQILMNLVGNAVKFTREGGIAVTGRVAGDADGERLVFTVRDTGPGIRREDLERIFAPFEQAGEEGAAAGGTGLGLAIARRLARLMGGTLGVESREGRGASFTLDLPLVTVEPAPEPMRPLAGRAVLLASPSSVTGPLLGRLLADLGAEICRVQSLAAAALSLSEARARRRPFDACLVDIGFGPDAAAGFARAASLDAARRRLVLLAPAERRHIEAMRRAGFDGYLVKPLRPASLVARIAGEETTAQEPCPAVPAIQPAPAGPGLSLLVAEDDAVNALITARLAAALGHRAVLVRSGAEAVAQFTQAGAGGPHFDAVLMDVHMPDMGGLEAARRIKALHEAGGAPGPAILAMSADPSGAGAALAAGMHAHLVKPLNAATLTAALETLTVRGPGRRERARA